MSIPGFRHALLAVSLLASAACATGAPRTASAARHDPDRITQEEIESNPEMSNLFDLVQRLRPAWLRGRGVERLGNATQVQVYYDGVRIGGPAALRGIRPGGVASLQFLNAGEATLRWGTGNSQGAISVLTH